MCIDLIHTVTNVVHFYVPSFICLPEMVNKGEYNTVRLPIFSVR